MSMIQIRKSKDDQFYVAITGKNNEDLIISEMFKTKQSAWKNIKAVAKVFNGGLIEVTDLTVNWRTKKFSMIKPITYYLNPENGQKWKK